MAFMLMSLFCIITVILLLMYSHVYYVLFIACFILCGFLVYTLFTYLSQLL